MMDYCDDADAVADAVVDDGLSDAIIFDSI